jgi:hypothetical protein
MRGDRKMADAPCYGCQDRELGCHASCEKYKAYRQDITAQKVDRAHVPDKKTLRQKRNAQSQRYYEKRRRMA